MKDGFEHKHFAYQSIARGLKEGVFKNCIHLVVGGGSTGGFGFNPYRPYCKEDMLTPYTHPGWGRIRECCPKDCALFKDKAAIERAEKLARWRKAWKSALKGPFIGFKGHTI